MKKVAVLLLVSACGGAAAPSIPPGTPVAPPVAMQKTSQTQTPPPAPKPPLDATKIATITGAKAETVDNVVRVSFPREDVKVDVDGWQKMPPFMGLTTWAGFVPGENANVEAMVMGDVVLFEDEVSSAMSAALDNGLEVTALHNHFFFDKPRVFFMHIGGEGTADQLAKAVKSILDAERAIRAKSPQVASAFGPSSPKGANKIDAEKLDAIFGQKGQSKDGMYKATMGRKTRAECGCTIGKPMGVNTWAAFGGTDDDAIVDGDFAVSESELQSVLKSLRTSGVHVVAIHSHMTNETPRVLFLHYWAHGKAADLANAVKRALDLTAWDGHTT